LVGKIATWKVDIDPSLVAFFETDGKSVTSKPLVVVVVVVVAGNNVVFFKA
jgi:hypothetical protein